MLSSYSDQFQEESDGSFTDNEEDPEEYNENEDDGRKVDDFILLRPTDPFDFCENT
jgi:hypothetical protein